MKPYRVVLTATVLAGVLCLVPPASAQDAGPRIWSGIFTEAQAERGKINFLQSCVRCHGADLAGVTAPALNAPRFVTAWENENLYKLFVKIRDTMPPNFGTILTDEAKLDVLAFILRSNGFPAGSTELKVDPDALEGVQILRKGASEVVTNFSIVKVLGCLEPGPNETWTLNHTTEPTLSRDTPSSPEELQRETGTPLGNQQFRLVSIRSFEPESHTGHKIEVKGLLYKDDSDARINVTSLQMVGLCTAQ